MTPQQRMKALLEKTGIPAKEINCYGSQIVVTTWSRNALDRWVSLLSRFARVQNTVESLDYCEENKNTVLMPSTVKVWRVWATI